MPSLGVLQGDSSCLQLLLRAMLDFMRILGCLAPGYIFRAIVAVILQKLAAYRYRTWSAAVVICPA